MHLSISISLYLETHMQARLPKIKKVVFLEDDQKKSLYRFISISCEMKAQQCVIGGGIVGLAVAAALSAHTSVVLLEKNQRYIAETSSRNSGVVHAGIYYPENCLKTSLCMSGNRHIWHLAAKGSVAAVKTGKWIGAVDDAEELQLQDIARAMRRRNIPFEWLDRATIRRAEPNVCMQSVVHSLNTGIVDVESLKNFFLSMIDNSPTESVAVLRSEVLKVEVNDNIGVVRVHVPGADPLECERVICCAGLGTPQIWSRITLNGRPLSEPTELRMYYCKGRYVGYRDRKIVSRLVYPCPPHGLTGLGVHSTIDMGGNVRFGPDTVFVDNPDDVTVTDDSNFIQSTFDAVSRYIPSVRKELMYVDFAGIRPKLSGPGMPFRDFSIDFLPDSGGRVVMLTGIESPGLTSCTAIADHVLALIGTPAKPMPWHG
jgi:L-2-hydroxyglutarate oxidase LhgO